jgi:tRNA(Ile)-lysidine synthase
MAARELRYHYFAALCRDLQTEGVCVAHHQDDSVETVLLNLIRGTGVHGLTGMAPLSVLESDLKVIRPLLCMSRHEIEQFLQDVSQDYVTDSTNLQSDMAVRNKIRMEVIPLLQQINPSVKNSIAETANKMYEVTKVLDDTIGKQLTTVMEEDDHPVSSDRVILSINRLKALPSSEYALFYILKDYGFNPAQIEQVAQHLDAVPGTEFRSSTHQLLVDRDRLLIEPIQEQPKTMTIPEEGTYVYNEHMKVRVEKMTVADLQTKDHEKSVSSILSSLPKNTAVLDAAQIRFPLVIRPVRQGDRFQPFGMKGSKLISDFLTDRKCTLFDKRRQLVVTDADNKILWLVNERPDDCCRVTESTQEVLQVTIS